MDNVNSKSKYQKLMTPIIKDKQLWESFGATELDDRTTITISLKIDHPSSPMVIVEVTPKKGKQSIHFWTPPNGITGTFGLFKFKVGKKKRLTFPFDLESFEINTGLVKAGFRRKNQ